jgi:hypothetical protein
MDQKIQKLVESYREGRIDEQEFRDQMFVLLTSGVDEAGLEVAKHGASIGELLSKSGREPVESELAVRKALTI